MSDHRCPNTGEPCERLEELAEELAAAKGERDWMHEALHKHYVRAVERTHEPKEEENGRRDRT